MRNNPVTLEAILVLDAIDRRGSYAAAAEQLNKVPSALSYIVQKLEEQLEVTIFQRQGRRSVLTPAGRHLLNEGRQILEAVNVLTDKTRAIATGWEPKLRIAIDSILDTGPIFRVINQFLKEHPFIEIDVSEEVLSGAWEALIDDRVDLLIGAPAPVPRNKGIHAVRFTDFDPVFAVSPEHPLAGCPQPVTAQQIAQQRSVVVHDTAQKSVPRTAGVIEESRYFYVPTIEYKIQAQLAGIGCGYLPRPRVRQYLESGALIELQVQDARPVIELSLAWKLVQRGKGLQKLREMLLELQE
jgi:DNA-binding transcriptional LysR family regulator